MSSKRFLIIKKNIYICKEVRSLPHPVISYTTQFAEHEHHHTSTRKRNNEGIICNIHDRDIHALNAKRRPVICISLFSHAQIMITKLYCQCRRSLGTCSNSPAHSQAHRSLPRMSHRFSISSPRGLFHVNADDLSTFVPNYSSNYSRVIYVGLYIHTYISQSFIRINIEACLENYMYALFKREFFSRECTI